VYQTAGGTKLNTLSQNAIYDNGKDIAACAPLNGQSTVADAGVCFEKEWLTSRISRKRGPKAHLADGRCDEQYRVSVLAS